MPRCKKRGPYKKWLRSSQYDIPESTLRSREKANLKINKNLENDSTEVESVLQNHVLDISNVSLETQFDQDYQAKDTVANSDSTQKRKNVSIHENINSNVAINKEMEIINYLDEDYESDVESTDSNVVDGEYQTSSDEQHVLSDQEETSQKYLYDGCDLTRAESQLILLSMSLRHSLTLKAVDDMVRVIDCHLPHDEYRSKYLFFKSFKQPTIIEYFYCPDCLNNLNFDRVKRVECSDCNKIWIKDHLKERGNFFYYLPIEEQFKDIVQSSLYSKFRKECKESDIVNSAAYRSMVEKNIIQPNDFTIQLNSDGVSLFKSSNKGITPILISINELPYRLRKDNIILAGLFFGTKPPMNVFMKPVSSDLRKLSIDGFESSTYRCPKRKTIRIHYLLSPVDSVERPKVQNFKQFNGKFGCSYCYHPGERIEVGGDWARVYGGDKKIARSHKDAIRHAKQADRTGKAVLGVKGTSVVLGIPHLDIIHGFPPEYMHACLLGIAKLFPSEWFDSKNNKEKWYLGNKKDTFNRRFLSIKPPKELTRTPQPIDDWKYKASECKNFICYYSLPCLHGLSKSFSKFLKHWLLFVYSISVFSKTQIRDEDLLLAENALRDFVLQTEKLYGKKFMKYNMHILLHIPLYIRKYGALWAWSTFPFEHFNGIIQHLFHGTQYISKQICEAYNKIRNVKNNMHIFNSPDCSENGKKRFKSLMNECRIKLCFECEDSLRIFGQPRRINLTLNQRTIIEQAVQYDLRIKVDTFQRFIYKNRLYHTQDYTRLKKRNNSTILTEEGTMLMITNLLAVRKKEENDHLEYVILGKKFNILEEIICENGPISSNLLSCIVEESNSYSCIKLSSLKSKCVSCPYKDNKFCLTPLINILETD